MKKYTILLAILLMTGLSSAFINWDNWNSWDSWDVSQDGDVAVIGMEGQITPSSTGFGADTITPEQVNDLNDDAIEQGADAIIYEWNSGGGSVVASKEVKDAIESTEVPTVCRFRDVAASGAYLASLGCDSIVSDSASMTGSIGVTGSYLEFSDLMEEYGVSYVNVTAGEHKETGSPFQEATEEDMEILEDLVDDVHKEFLTAVDEGRNMSDEELEEVETGRIMLGSEAEELNMVDEIGGQDRAVEEAENLTEMNLETFRVETYQPFNFLDLLLMDTGFNQFFQEFHLTSRLG